jgi:SAM-dependent methyltransferase
VQEVWQRLGEVEAHWSVATIEDFRPDRIQQSLATFFATGERDIETLWCTLRRVGIDTTRLATALDFGCGVGRLSMALAKRVRALESADVSASHLKLAQEAAVERQQINIRFHHLKRIGDIADLPEVDLVYSVIVLQHNPPPVIRSIFAQLLGRLSQGGVAVIQVPTYLPEGYAFDAEAYGTTHSSQMEMHPLPQRVAFSVIRSAGCEVLEVLEDAWTGYGCGARSNTFVIQRPAL